jgi:hypothetical protein
MMLFFSPSPLAALGLVLVLALPNDGLAIRKFNGDKD